MDKRPINNCVFSVGKCLREAVQEDVGSCIKFWEHAPFGEVSTAESSPEIQIQNSVTSKFESMEFKNAAEEISEEEKVDNSKNPAKKVPRRRDRGNLGNILENTK